MRDIGDVRLCHYLRLAETVSLVPYIRGVVASRCLRQSCPNRVEEPGGAEELVYFTIREVLSNVGLHYHLLETGYVVSAVDHVLEDLLLPARSVEVARELPL